MCLHKAQRSASSCPLCRAPAFSLTFFLHRKTISCCSVSLTPPTSVPLSLSWDSFTIVRIRSAPNLREASQGPLLIVSSKRQPAEGKMTALKARVPLYFLFALLSFPLYACSYSRVTHCSRLPLLSRKACLSQAAECATKWVSSSKKEGKTDEPGDFWATFHHFSSTSYTDPVHNGIPFSKYGREAGVASTFTACQIGRFTKRSCAPTTHTNYPNTTHTLAVESRQTGFLLCALAGRESHQVVLMCCLLLLPAAGISESHWTISTCQWGICEQTSLERKSFTAAAQEKQLTFPAASLDQVLLMTPLQRRQDGDPAHTDKSNVHQINRGSSATERPISLCWSQVYCTVKCEC